MSSGSCQSPIADNLRTDLVAASSGAFADLVEEWRVLWTQTADREPYSHPGWVMAYAASFEPSVPLSVLTVRRGKALVAVLPLLRSTTVYDGMPARLLRAPMNPHSFRVQLLSSPDAPIQTVCALWRHIASLRGWDVFVIGRLAKTDAASRIAGSLAGHSDRTLVDGHRPNRLFLLPDAAAARGDQPWLDGATPRMKRSVRKAMRKVMDDIGAEPELDIVETADSEALGRFFDLEASGWKGRDGTAIKCAANTLKFYSEVAQAVSRDGALRLHFLRFRGIPVAGAFSVAADTRLHVLKWGYDEAYTKYHPGQLLCAALLRDCLSRGVREMDIGDDAKYKGEWTATAEDHEFLYVFSRTLYGRSLYVYRAKLRPALGRLLLRWRRTPKTPPAAEAAAD